MTNETNSETKQESKQFPSSPCKPPVSAHPRPQVTASERLTGIRREDWLKWFQANMQCYPGTQVSTLQGPKEIRLSAKIMRKMRHSIAVYLSYCNTTKERKEIKAMLQEVETKLKELDIALPLAEKSERDNKVEQQQIRVKVKAEIEARKEERKEAERKSKGKPKKGSLLDMLEDDLD